MEKLVPKVSILISFIFFLLLKLEFKYLIVYFILLNLIVIFNFLFLGNKKNLNQEDMLILGGSIVANFLIIVISYYTDLKLIAIIPIILQLAILIYLKKQNVKEKKENLQITKVNNLEKYQIYIKKINRRLELCNEELLNNYQLSNINNKSAGNFLDEIKLKIKDLEDERNYLNEEIIKGNISFLNNEKVIESLENLYIDVENIRICLGRMYSKMKKQNYIVQISNDGYLDFIKNLEQKMDCVLDEVKNNNSTNKNFFKHIKSELEIIDDKVINLTGKFNKDMDRIFFNLSENPKAIIEALVDFDKNINSNLENIYKNIELKIQNSIMKDGEAQEEIFRFLEEKNKEQQEFIEKERQKYIDIFIEKISMLDISTQEEILKYKENFSEEGFSILNNAEVLYNTLTKNKVTIDDYSPIYISYTKFLEYEISKKMNLKAKDTSFGILIKKISKDLKWLEFMNKFNNIKIRNKRNLAAHGGKDKITLADVKEIREFIFDEDIIKILGS